MLSVAHIPWMGSSFTGFLGFFLNDTTLHRFGTYTQARIQLVTSTPDSVKIIIAAKEHTYYVEAHHSKSGLLKAPVKGSMDRRIAESIDAKLTLTVLDKNATVVFQDSTSIAGLEIVGDLRVLNGSKKR